MQAQLHNYAYKPPLTTTQNSRSIRGNKIMIANQKPKSKNLTKFAPISTNTNLIPTTIN